jgi:hypothetical protein
MIKLFKQLEQKSARLLVGVTLFVAAVVIGVPAPASAASADGYWGQLISKNSLPYYKECLSKTWQPGVTVFQDHCENNSWQLWHMTPVGGGYFNIISNEVAQDGTHHCLDVYAFSHDYGAKVTTWPCNGYTNQQWYLKWVSSDSFILKPRHAISDGPYYVSPYKPPLGYPGTYPAGKCLDVSGYSQSNGAQVFQWECLGGANQQWSYDGSW